MAQAVTSGLLPHQINVNVLDSIPVVLSLVYFFNTFLLVQIKFSGNIFLL